MRALIPILGLTLLVSIPAAVAARQDSASAGNASTGSQPQPAIAFDQIDRVLLRGQAPPPVDSFAADAATIASLPPLTASVPGKGRAVARTAGNMLISTAVSFIPIAGPFIAGAASRAANAAEQAADRRAQEAHNAAVLRFVSAGTLSRFAFYHGWLRSERGSEVTIVKPDQSLTWVLDSTRRTVQTIDMRTAPETIEIDTTAMAPPALVGDVHTERLPDATIAGLVAHGYRTSGTIDLKHAVNWCATGRHPVEQIEYVTDLPDPQDSDVTQLVQGLADGCQPATTASYREPGHLVLYRATTTDPDTRQSVTIMFERGNMRQLDSHSVTLFSVPDGFTKEQ